MPPSSSIWDGEHWLAAPSNPLALLVYLMYMHSLD